jgi:hypothetical protein
MICMEIWPGQRPFRWGGETVCKTVGSAYVGSNPTPATTYNASSSGMRPDHRRWLLWLSADLAGVGRVQAVFCVARSEPCGRFSPEFAGLGLASTVEWWLGRSRAAAVTGEAGRWSLRWPAGSLRYAAGAWTPAGAGFSTAPSTVPGRLPQASVRPSPPPAQRPVPGWHDARRRLPRGPREGNRCRARRLGPGKYRHREAGVIPACKASRPGRPKSSVMPSSPPAGVTSGRGPRPARQLLLRRSPSTGFSSSSGRSAPMTDAAGTLLTASSQLMQPAHRLALSGVSRDQQAHGRL